MALQETKVSLDTCRAGYRVCQQYLQTEFFLLENFWKYMEVSEE